jgi:hypothetical protein
MIYSWFVLLVAGSPGGQLWLNGDKQERRWIIFFQKNRA